MSWGGPQGERDYQFASGDQKIAEPTMTKSVASAVFPRRHSTNSLHINIFQDLISRCRGVACFIKKRKLFCACMFILIGGYIYERALGNRFLVSVPSFVGTLNDC